MKSLRFKQHAQARLTFKRWGRKNYSVFSTLRKMVVISVLSVTYLLSAPATTLATETDTTEVKMQYDLDEIEVSAQRSPALYSQVARVISVLERKEIEAIPAQSVQDLLEYVAGVDVRQRGAEGVQADVSIRGGTFDQTLILLNGINITDPQTGHHNLNLPVSLSEVERIEVLEGPAARIYGPNAFSGAINIITRQPSDNLLRAALSAGSFGYLNANLSGSFATGNFHHLLAANHKTSDGYISNTDFNISNLFYSNHVATNRGKFNFQSGYSQKGFGANSFYTAAYPNQFEQTKTLFSSIKWQSSSKMHLTPSVYWRRHQDRFELFRNNPASWYKGHNYHLTNTYGLNLNSWFQWKYGKTAFGLEGRKEHILSNVLGEEMENSKPVPGEDALFTKSKARNTVAVFFEHVYYINNLSLGAGVMANYITESDLGINFFPGVDIGYYFFPELKLFCSYNTALRMPTFTDLYYAGPTNIGNPDLEPEKSATLDGGLKWNSKLISGQMAVFYRQGKDIIDWVKQNEDEKWQAQNLTRLNSLGAEIQTQVKLKDYFGGHLPNTVYFSFFYNSLQKEDFNYISNYALDNLRLKFVGAINQSIHKNIELSLNVTFQDREGSYTSYQNSSPGQQVAYDPFCLFDGKINYRKKGFGAFVSVNNIFDRKFNDIGNVQQPGRWLKLGVSYQLNIY
jgi:iron complex outermembrane receptor protein